MEKLTPKLEIRIARPEDADDLREVHAVSWLATYPNEELGITTDDVRIRMEGENGELVNVRVDRWRNIIKTIGQDHTVFIALLDNKIVGFIAPSIDKRGQHRVGSIYLLPEAQGEGIGMKLMEKELEWHGNKDVYLVVATYNAKAINFYEKFGFKKTSRTIPEEELVKFASGNVMPEVEMVRNKPSP